MFAVSAFLISCATPYYGYTKNDWESLSEEEQTAVKAEYQDIIDSKKEQKHKDLLESYKQKIIDAGVSPKSRF